MKRVKTRAVTAATAANATHFFIDQVVQKHGADAVLLTEKMITLLVTLCSKL